MKKKFDTLLMILLTIVLLLTGMGYFLWKQKIKRKKVTSDQDDPESPPTGP